MVIQKDSKNEYLISIKKAELKKLKKEEMRRISKIFITFPSSLRKSLLPKISLGLFGELMYEADIFHYASNIC